MDMRKSIAAGSFYPSNEQKLKKQIGDFLRKTREKTNRLRKKIYGVIAPHAGYTYSGECAAYAYNSIAESEKIDTFIILGTNHTGYAESDFALSAEDFETPLGIVKNDADFYKALLSESKKQGKISVGDTNGDKLAHQNEHSIEVQLPFLQFILGKKFMMLPIICQIKEPMIYTAFARLISETSKKLKRKVCVIASSDFTHFGFSYGFTPFVSDIKKNLYELDGKAIELIEKFKTKQFLEHSSRTTICGAGAISACIEICKEFRSTKAELIKYYTSGDITGDYSSAVGYGSIAFS